MTAIRIRKPEHGKSNSLKDFLKSFNIAFGHHNRFLKPLSQLIFALVPVSAFNQSLMQNDPFFQFANSSPKRTLKRVGMLFAETLRRKPMANETLELCELAILDLIQRTVAFRTGGRDLIARRFAGRTIGSCLIL